MASLVRRKDGRSEIRETLSTPRGPRSRTLAVFRELTDKDLEKAERRATRPFDRGRILRRARELGVPRYGESASRAARALLAELHAGRPLEPVLVAALGEALAGRPETAVPKSIAPLLPKLAADAVERGEELREVLHVPFFRAPGAWNESAFSKAPIDDQLVGLSRGLRQADIDHAFGGAIAHAYYTELVSKETPLAVPFPVFLTASGRVSARLELRGLLAPVPLAYGAELFQSACTRRARDLPFGEDALPIVSAEDLLISELLLPGPSWARIEQLLFCRVGSLDVEYVRDWVEALLPGDPRREHFARTVAALAGL